MPLDQWKGAVLFLIDNKYVYLIKRSEDMPSHSGQIGFIGGHKKVYESSPTDVAVREFIEETSLDSTTIKTLGFLKPVYTARHWPIVPVLAELLIPSSDFLTKIKSNGEWDYLLAYSWENLIREDSWSFAWRNGLFKSPVLFHHINKSSYLSSGRSDTDMILWGATAQMIWNFLRSYQGLKQK